MAKYSLGGQAVIEGVMILNQTKNELSIAVRKPNNKIIVKKTTPDLWLPKAGHCLSLKRAAYIV